MRVNYTNVNLYFSNSIYIIMYIKEFIDNFHDGLDLYLDGYWDDAKE